MNDLTPILLVLLAVAVIAVVSFWRKIAKLEQFLKAEQKALEDKREEIERAKKDARDRRDELETARKQLTEAKTKLTKRDRKEEGAASKGSKKSAAAEAEAAAPSVSAIVRITDQELEAQHRRTVERFEQELATARAEVGRLRDLEERRSVAAERAAEALSQAAAPTPAEPIVVVPPASELMRSPSEEVEALKTQLEALKRAAIEREKDLKRKLEKSEDGANHALRRAANNQQLYQVIKGQLELAEDRLAQLRRKYEGAKSIDELRREQRKKDRQRRPGEGRPANGARDEQAGAGGEHANIEETADMRGPRGASQAGEGASSEQAQAQGGEVPVVHDVATHAPAVGDVATEATQAPQAQTESTDANAAPAGEPDAR